ncbi:MAG: vWA domain-containing protein [Polyangiaceae bacterium]
MRISFPSHIVFLAAVSLAACSSNADNVQIGQGGNGNNAGSSSGGTSNTNGGATQGQGGSTLSFGGASSAGGSSSGGVGGSCASQNADAKVQPVFLAFAFDVSGSMGQGDQPWHDKAKKWDPVVAATKAFFTDPASNGLTAALTLFPDASNKCEDSSYTAPDVPWTPLPSDAFGNLLDGYPGTPASWRGGTPTLHVVRGTIASLQQRMQTTPGRYVLVLVTDGYPQGCSDNAIASVVNVVSGVAATIPTYVVGVKNPPVDGAPDTVTDLNAVAVAGRTDHAYIIDTGNPTQTAADFRATIDKIRASSISCNVDIPPPPNGSTFAKENVAVTYKSGGNTTALSYDANCTAPNTWHYDNPTAPKQVLLCDSTCATVQADSNATLNFEFTCEPRVTVPL